MRVDRRHLCVHSPELSKQPKRDSLPENMAVPLMRRTIFPMGKVCFRFEILFRCGSAIWIIRTCVRWCARRRQIGLEVLKCSTSHMTSINAERSVHNNHISAIHASALIKCLIWLHIYYFLFIDIDKYARGALARTFHFPILFRIHRCCSLRHIDMCLFWLLSCFHDKSHNIFACIFNRMVDVKVYFPPLLSAEQKTNLVFRFTGLNLTLYTPGLSYILLHRVPNT